MLPSTIRPKVLAKNQAENLTVGQIVLLQNTFILEKRNKSMLSPRVQPPVANLDNLIPKVDTSQVIIKAKPRPVAQNSMPHTPNSTAARSHRAHSQCQKSGQAVPKSYSRLKQRKHFSPTSRNNMSSALGTKEQKSLESYSIINYSNLAEPFNRTGSRIQRRQLEELEVLKSDNSVLGRAELPDVISTVKESITKG